MRALKGSYKKGLIRLYKGGFLGYFEVLCMPFFIFSFLPQILMLRLVQVAGNMVEIYQAKERQREIIETKLGLVPRLALAIQAVYNARTLMDRGLAP